MRPTQLQHDTPLCLGGKVGVWPCLVARVHVYEIRHPEEASALPIWPSARITPAVVCHTSTTRAGCQANPADTTAAGIPGTAVRMYASIVGCMGKNGISAFWHPSGRPHTVALGTPPRVTTVQGSNEYRGGGDQCSNAGCNGSPGRPRHAKAYPSRPGRTPSVFSIFYHADRSLFTRVRRCRRTPSSGPSHFPAGGSQ